MSKEAMKLALEALESYSKSAYIKQQHPKRRKNGELAIKALEEALAKQGHGEPVAWVIWLHGHAGIYEHKQFAECELERRNKEYPDENRKLLPLYTTPQQRTWVGLDPEEIRKTNHHMVDGAYHYSFKQGAEWAEAKLKEKNT